MLNHYFTRELDAYPSIFMAMTTFFLPCFLSSFFFHLKHHMLTNTLVQLCCYHYLFLYVNIVFLFVGLYIFSLFFHKFLSRTPSVYDDGWWSNQNLLFSISMYYFMSNQTTYIFLYLVFSSLSFFLFSFFCNVTKFKEFSSLTCMQGETYYWFSWSFAESLGSYKVFLIHFYF